MSGSHDILSWEPLFRLICQHAAPLLKELINPFINLVAHVVGIVDERVQPTLVDELWVGPPLRTTAPKCA